MIGSGRQAALPDDAGVELFPDDEDLPEDDEDPPEDDEEDEPDEDDEPEESDEDDAAAGDDVDSLVPDPPSAAEDVAEAPCFAPFRESLR